MELWCEEKKNRSNLSSQADLKQQIINRFIGQLREAVGREI